MKLNYRLSFSLVAASSLACAFVCAASDLSITTETGRPVHEASRILEEKYGWRISYEDPPYAARELSRFRSIGLLVPRPMPSAFVIAQRAISTSAGEKSRVVHSIVEQHRSNGGTAFIALDNGDFTHIVPSDRRDESGTRVPYRSLLSERISFAAHDCTVGEVVETVLQEVSASRGVTVQIGMVPTSLFSNEHQMRGALDEPAEDVLVKTFELASHIGEAAGAPARRMTWDLLYDPDGKQFFFNVHVVPNTVMSRTTGASRVAGGN